MAITSLIKICHKITATYYRKLLYLSVLLHSLIVASLQMHTEIISVTSDTLNEYCSMLTSFD